MKYIPYILIIVLLSATGYYAYQANKWEKTSWINYKAADSWIEAHKKLSKENADMVTGYTSLFEEAHITEFIQINGAYPCLPATTKPKTTEDGKGFLRFGGCEQDTSKPYIATSTEITLTEGCDPVFLGKQSEHYVEEYKPGETYFSFLGMAEKGGNVYEIKCQ